MVKLRSDDELYKDIKRSKTWVLCWFAAFMLTVFLFMVTGSRFFLGASLIAMLVILMYYVDLMSMTTRIEMRSIR